MSLCLETSLDPIVKVLVLFLRISAYLEQSQLSLFTGRDLYEEIEATLSFVKQDNIFMIFLLT